MHISGSLILSNDGVFWHANNHWLFCIITTMTLNQYICNTWKEANIPTSIPQDVIQHSGIQVITYCDITVQFLRIFIVGLDTPGFPLASPQLDEIQNKDMGPCLFVMLLSVRPLFCAASHYSLSKTIAWFSSHLCFIF